MKASAGWNTESCFESARDAAPCILEMPYFTHGSPYFWWVYLPLSLLRQVKVSIGLLGGNTTYRMGITLQKEEQKKKKKKKKKN